MWCHENVDDCHSDDADHDCNDDNVDAAPDDKNGWNNGGDISTRYDDDGYNGDSDAAPVTDNDTV